MYGGLFQSSQAILGPATTSVPFSHDVWLTFPLENEVSSIWEIDSTKCPIPLHFHYGSAEARPEPQVSS